MEEEASAVEAVCQGPWALADWALNQWNSRGQLRRAAKFKARGRLGKTWWLKGRGTLVRLLEGL